MKRPAVASYRSWASIIALVAESLWAPPYAAAATHGDLERKLGQRDRIQDPAEDGTTGTFAEIVTTAANVARYVDAHRRLRDHRRLPCARLQPAGNSAYTNEACGTAPSIVIDNGQPGTSFMGTWAVSSAPTPSAGTRSTAR